MREKHRLAVRAGRLAKKTGNTNEAPAPLPVENMAPAPLPVENEAPAPLPVGNETPAPLPVENEAPAPLPVENMAPAPPPVEDGVQTKKHVCGTCGTGFAQRSHLKRHFEVKHTDQTTLQAVAKRQKLKESDKKAKRERRVDNPILREKHRLESQAHRLATKVGNTNEAPAPLPIGDEASAPLPVAGKAPAPLPVADEAPGTTLQTVTKRQKVRKSGTKSFHRHHHHHHHHHHHPADEAPAPLPVTIADEAPAPLTIANEAPAPVAVAGRGGGGGADGGRAEAEQKAPTEKNGRWVWVEGDVAATLDPPSTASATVACGGGGGGGADAPVSVVVAVVAPPPPAAVMVPSKRKKPVTVLPTLEYMMWVGRGGGE